MEFKLEKYATLIGYTNDNGKKGYFPTYHIDIDGDAIADEWSEYDLTPEDIADALSECEQEISRAINKIVNSEVVRYCVSPTRVIVKSHVDKQEWRDDYAYWVSTEDFDCGLALDKIELACLPPTADDFEPDDRDDVYEWAKYLGLSEWDGPYEFYIDNCIAYDRYIAARVLNEYGVELRG